MQPKRSNPYADGQPAKKKVPTKKQQEDRDYSSFRRPILSPHVKLGELRDFYEFNLSVPHNDLTIACGERFSRIPDESMFVVRLMRLNQETGKVACIEFGMESFDMLRIHEVITSNLLRSCEKALIFQNGDVQLYVMEENRADGFLAHFEDRRRVKVSINAEELHGIAAYRKKIEREYSLFMKRTAERRRRMEKKKPAEDVLPSSVVARRVVNKACVSYAEQSV